MGQLGTGRELTRIYAWRDSTRGHSLLLLVLLLQLLQELLWSLDLLLPIILRFRRPLLLISGLISLVSLVRIRIVR